MTDHELPLDCSVESLDRLLVERLHSEEGRRIMERQTKGASMTEQDFIIELAEKVLGAKIERVKRGVWAHLPDGRGLALGFPIGHFGPDSFDWNPLTSDADALGLVDAATTKEAGFWFQLRSPWDPKRPDAVMWRAGLTPHGCTGWNGTPDHCHASGDRRQAICYAIARAHGIELPEGA